VKYFSDFCISYRRAFFTNDPIFNLTAKEKVMETIFNILLGLITAAEDIDRKIVKIDDPWSGGAH
jgi:hypothetical protein